MYTERCILSTRRVPSYRGEVDRVTGRYVAGLSWLGLSGRWFSGLLHEGVGFAVAVALESDHPAVVDGTVDDRGGHVGVAEDPAPSAELDVGGRGRCSVFRTRW